MKFRGCTLSFLLIATFLLVAGSVDAQQGTIAGTIADESGAVLPGVSITVTSQGTGRAFEAFADGAGAYFVPGVPPGIYEVRAVLSGFSTSIVEEVELLVGQNATMDFTMLLAAVEESITVSGVAPLIDIRTAAVSGNIDRRQMEQLPVQGRDWMELSLMVKGVTGNDVGANRAGGVGRENEFQLNLDGQQITSMLAGSNSFGQPGLSRDAIAEYQIVTNLYDVTQGRSSGLQVNAITKSGTNVHSGTAFGFFRHDSLNAADFVAEEVIPFENQQVGFTLGGPIVENRLFYFGSYETEREPSTLLMQPRFFSDAFQLSRKVNVNNILGKVDYQPSTNDHLMVRYSYFTETDPNGQVTNAHYPSQITDVLRRSHMVTGNWTRVTGSNLLHEVKVSYFQYHWDYSLGEGVPFSPGYNFPGRLRFGSKTNQPQKFWEDTPGTRYDLTFTTGAHDAKLGVEYLRVHDTSCWPNNQRGRFQFGTLPPDLERRFPLDAWNDASRWDLSGLDSSALFWTQAVAQGEGLAGNCGDWEIDLPRDTWAFWLGDTWRVSDKLTLNLGVRYDLPWGDLATPGVQDTDLIIDNGLFTENVGYRSELRDTNNVAPRVGFAYDPTGNADFVIKGGSGIYYTHNAAMYTLFQQHQNGQRILNTFWANDGLPGFLDDPTRGVDLSEVLAGTVPVGPQNVYVMSHDMELPHAWQSTLGFQKQLGSVSAFDADLIYVRGYNEQISRDPNLFYDPENGFNKHPNVAGRPAPQFGQMILFESKGSTDSMLLATSYTRRFQDNFQANVNYTLMFFKNDDTGGAILDGFGGGANNPFDRDLSDEWARSVDFQRSTLRANAIWALPYDFSLALSFFYGSGNYFSTTTSSDPFGNAQVFSTSTRTRIESDGSITVVPRNDLKGDPIHKLDIRLSKDLVMGDNVRLQGIAEVFNLYNHANFGAYNASVGAPGFGDPRQNPANAYFPRVWQLGFRLSY